MILATFQSNTMLGQAKIIQTADFSVTSEWIINLHSCLNKVWLQQTMVLCNLHIIKHCPIMLQSEQHLQLKIALYSHLKALIFSDHVLWSTFGTDALSKTYLPVSNTIKKLSAFYQACYQVLMSLKPSALSKHSELTAL